MSGKEMCGLSKEEFCSRAPVFVGDILWEHLVLLQQDVDREKAALKNAPSNLSETSTDPVSLPPSPQMYPVSSQSPQKTYHTLSPHRHTPYPAPNPTYTNLAPRQPSPPLNIKTEYPPAASIPVTSHMTSSYNQYHGQYQATYQRLASHPVYPGNYPYNVYDMQATAAAAVSQQYPAPMFPSHPAPDTGRQWPGPGQTSSYQVRYQSDNITLLTNYPAPLHPPPLLSIAPNIILFKDYSYFLPTRHLTPPGQPSPAVLAPCCQHFSM